MHSLYITTTKVLCIFTCMKLWMPVVMMMHGNSIIKKVNFWIRELIFYDRTILTSLAVTLNDISWLGQWHFIPISISSQSQLSQLNQNSITYYKIINYQLCKHIHSMSSIINVSTKTLRDKDIQQAMITFQMSCIQPLVHQDHVSTDHVCVCDVEMKCHEAAHNR